MLFKLIILAAIAYFIVKAVIRLAVAAYVDELGARRQAPRSFEPPRSQARPTPRPEPRPESAPRVYTDRDIEDARWEDIS